MRSALVAVIGGTGVGERLRALPGRALARPTSSGSLRGRLLELDGTPVLALARHGAGHRTPPHAAAYGAAAIGCAALGVKACFATAAVGSLRADWPTGTLAVCSDLIDLTCRRLTLFERSVRHTDMTSPFPARGLLLQAARELGIEVVDGAVYAGADGPRYETPAEVEAERRLGADVAGMTASSEAILFREAGVPYACLAVCTNLASGLSDGELGHGEVVDAMRERADEVLAILARAARLASP